MGEEELRELGCAPASPSFLDISRQAVYKQARGGLALGLQGAGTTWFPLADRPRSNATGDGGPAL